MNQPANKVVLITGAKGGLGTCVTQAFLTTGATVVGSSRSVQASDFAHPDFVPIPAELSSLEGAQALADAVIAPVAETDDATFERMLDLNLLSAFHVTRAVIPHMRRQAAGRVVAVAGRAALEPQALVGAYSASKAALVSLMRTLAPTPRPT